MSPASFASALVAGQKKWRRKESDFYPTPADVTAAIMRHLALPDYTMVWEPACGAGDMLRVMRHEGPRLGILASDLRRDIEDGLPGVDFLHDAPPFEDVDWIVTNPPFSHAVEFICRCAELHVNFALLLKTTFWSAATRTPLFQAHPPDEILPLTWRPAFLEAERGSSPVLEAAWFVWRTDRARRRYTPLVRPKDHRELRSMFPISKPD